MDGSRDDLALTANGWQIVREERTIIFQSGVPAGLPNDMILVNRMNTDSQDLPDYCATGSEAAFRRLVEWHAPMVHGVAMRMSRNASLAEEITQSVFIILARKALSIPPAHLPGWLYKTAASVSRNVTRKEARRSVFNQQYTEAMNRTLPDSEPWNEITPHLDEAVGKLSREDRQMMVLRYFEQRNFQEIAAVVGASEEACKKRAQRALERLGALLRKRGVMAGGPVLGTAIATFALLPPSASAASISGVALGSAGSLVTSAPSFFKLLQSMTTKQITTVAAAPAFKLLTALPPILALSAGVIWTVSQGHAIASLDSETALYQRGLDIENHRDLGSVPGKLRPVTAKLPVGKIDWKAFSAASNDLALSVAIKRRMQTMSPAELMAQLDEIDQLEVGNKAAMAEMVIAWLAIKDPKGLLERYAGRLSQAPYEHELAYAFSKWSSVDPGDAAEWLDRKIAGGTFDDPSLDGTNWQLRRYEILLISHLLDSDPQATTARVLAIPEAGRGEILQVIAVRAKTAQTLAVAELIRSTLPQGQWEETVGKIDDPGKKEAIRQALVKAVGK